MSPRSRYHRALQAVETILSEYTIEFINQQRLLYLSTRCSNLRKFEALYRKYARNKKVIDDYEVLHPLSKCENCQRRVVNETSNFYSLSLVRRSSDCLRRRKFKHVTVPTDYTTQIHLCYQCDSYLTSDQNDVSSNMELAWPSYVWYLFKDKDIQRSYGPIIWRYIPTTWRHWWIESVKETFPQIYSPIQLHLPTPFFEDRTFEIKEWNENINSHLLSNLAMITNKYLLPRVRCPWGCSEFHHKAGFLPLDIIYQRYLQKCSLKTVTPVGKHMEKFVVSAREDYLNEERNDVCWLFNPKWKILPSISHIPGKGPCVLTCKDHNGGTKKFMIHTVQWQHNLPSKQPDQLCQAVVNPRTLKPVKPSKYSTSYQMFQQTGTFNGLDTCTHTSYGNFDFTSKLNNEAEARSLANRPDINAHLGKLSKDGIISTFVENGKRQFATRFSETKIYKKFTKGATFVSLQASMILQREMSGTKLQVVVDHDVNR